MSVLLAASGDGFEAPGTSAFWWPLFGTGEWGQWAITRPAVVLLLSAIGLAVWLTLATRRLAVVPGKGQYFVEQVYGLVRNSIARDLIGSRDFLKFVPLLFTMFTLILVNNLFGVVPFVNFPTASRVAFPLVLAVVVYLIYHAVGIRKRGLVPYLRHLIPAGVPGWLLPVIVPLEFFTYFITRPVTLALRLFGNMFAGHLLLLLFILAAEYLLFQSDGVGLKAVGVLSYGMAFLMTIFELVVEFLQAYIFTLLSALYIAGSLADEH